jgi:hypothetical protein
LIAHVFSSLPSSSSTVTRIHLTQSDPPLPSMTPDLLQILLRKQFFPC